MISATDFPKIRALYEQGKTDMQIAGTCGYTRQEVFHWRKKAELPANTHPGGSRPRNPERRARYQY